MKPEWTDLAERKRLLVLQADLHRAVLRAEYVSVRARLSWLNGAGGQARSASRWLAAGAAATGLLAAWRGRKLAGWIPAAITAWRVWKKLKTGGDHG